MIYFGIKRKNNNYYLNDEYLLNNEIVKYYNTYPYLNTSFDNIFQRLKWIKSQKDNGQLYFYVLSLLNNQKNKQKIQYIENKINNTKNEIKAVY